MDAGSSNFSYPFRVAIRRIDNVFSAGHTARRSLDVSNPWPEMAKKAQPRVCICLALVMLCPEGA
jgi:hypothetical protein